MNFSRYCLLCLRKYNNLLDMCAVLEIDLDIEATVQEHFWFDGFDVSLDLY